jgi:hypothetical protein
MEMIFIFWLAFAIIVGVAANTRGRNGGGWFILAVLISPLLAGLLLLALPKSIGSSAAHREEITIVQQRDITSGALLAHRKVTPELLDLIAQRSTENLKPLDVIVLLREGIRVYTQNSYFIRDQ